MFISLLPLLLCIVLSQLAYAQRGRTRIRTPAPAARQPPPPPQQRIQEAAQEAEEADYDEDSTPEPALQYYSATQGQDNQNRVVLVASDDEYNGLYGRPTTIAPRARSDYSRPISKSTSAAAARQKDVAPKETVQTIRNYSKVNDDGSFTFGYEAADGSFKEETRGTDCVVRGKYGYIDPDGNKREFTYVSGNPCDPNNPDQTEEEPEREEDINEPENVPVNFPRRPIARPTPAPQRQQTTTHAPTTVFQNQYTSNAYGDDAEDDEQGQVLAEPESIQSLQPQRPRASARPQHIPVPDEVNIRQRPRITINTTPAPALYQIQTQPTARPAYREPTQPPATTYRPSVQYFTQKAAPVPVTFAKPVHLAVEPLSKTTYTSTRKPLDFAAEFQKFQQENTIAGTTTPRATGLKTYRPPTSAKLEIPSATPNPIYETQLVFDPATGQIDSYPQNVAYRLPAAFVQQQQQPFHPSPQIVTLEQLQQQQQQQSSQPIYQRPLQVPSTRSPLTFPQFSQQVYHKDHENLQVLNSQQLYAQQQELQNQQLHQDRVEAAKKQTHLPGHRFQLTGQQQLAPFRQSGFFYQPSQINPFLR